MADQDNAGGRGENSVLFSLSNLTAVGRADAATEQTPRQPDGAGQAGGGNAGQDRSGLIDLNTLTQLGAGGGAAPGGAGPAAAPGASDAAGAAVPALFNVGTRRSNKGLMLGIGFLVVVVLGLGGFVTYLLAFKEDPEAGTATAEAAEANPEDEEVELDGAAAANKGKAIDEQGDDAEAKDGDDAETKDGDDAEAKDGEGEDGDTTAEGDEDGKEASAMAAAVDDSGKDDDDDDDDRKSSRSSSRRSKDKDRDSSSSSSSSSKSKGDELNKSEVGKVLKSSALKAKSCGSGGDVVIKFSIKPDGGTRGVVTVGGSLAGTPAAKCVEKVVKGLKFPKSSDGAKGVKYPYKL